MSYCWKFSVIYCVVNFFFQHVVTLLPLVLLLKIFSNKTCGELNYTFFPLPKRDPLLIISQRNPYWKIARDPKIYPHLLLLKCSAIKRSLNFGIPGYFSVRIPLRNNEQRIPFREGEKMYSSIHHTFYCWKFQQL